MRIKRAKIKAAYYLFSLVFMLSLWGCYTSFQHPDIKDAKWGAVQVSDDCRQCHNQSRYSASVLPKSAERDYNWQFYSSAPWWQDEMAVDAAPVAGGPETTGPRNRNGSGEFSAPPVTPIPAAPVQSLGKSTSNESSNDSASKDKRRSVGRRTTTTSDSKAGAGNKRGSRSRRKEN